MGLYLVKSEAITFVEASSKKEAMEIYRDNFVAKTEDVTEVNETSSKEMHKTVLN